MSIGLCLTVQMFQQLTSFAFVDIITSITDLHLHLSQSCPFIPIDLLKVYLYEYVFTLCVFFYFYFFFYFFTCVYVFVCLEHNFYNNNSNNNTNKIIIRIIYMQRYKYLNILRFRREARFSRRLITRYTSCSHIFTTERCRRNLSTDVPQFWQVLL